MMKTLIVDINASTRGGYTPTQIAADYDNIQCLLELVVNGADTSIYNLSHKDPLDFLSENHPSIRPFNKAGNVIVHQDGHLAVKMLSEQIGGEGYIVSLHDFL